MPETFESRTGWKLYSHGAVLRMPLERVRFFLIPAGARAQVTMGKAATFYESHRAAILSTVAVMVSSHGVNSSPMARALAQSKLMWSGIARGGPGFATSEGIRTLSDISAGTETAICATISVHFGQAAMRTFHIMHNARKSKSHKKKVRRITKKMSLGQSALKDKACTRTTRSPKESGPSARIF